MATFLAALRFAVNVEDHLQHLQTDRFRHCGDISARLFPPLIPIAGLAGMPRESTLDAFRKRHVLEVAATQAMPHDAQGEERLTPPAAYSPQISNYGTMVTDFIQTFEEEYHEVAGSVPRELYPPPDAPPLVRLGWTDSVSQAPPPGLPKTRAVWLCIFSVTPAAGARWWNGCTWQLWYTRRFSTRARSEATVTPRR